MEVHNGLAIAKMSGSFMRERMVVVNLTFHTLAGIDDQSCETLKYIKQEDAMAFQITINTAEKSFKEVSARRNSFAMNFWMTKTNACNAQTFIDEKELGEYVFKISKLIFALFVACSSIKSFSCHHFSSTYPLYSCYSPQSCL